MPRRSEELLLRILVGSRKCGRRGGDVGLGLEEGGHRGRREEQWLMRRVGLRDGVFLMFEPLLK